jgi:predicted Zn-dependent protease
MAIDKSRTSPFMKAMILVLVVAFVGGIGFAGLEGLQSCTPNAPLLPNGSSSAGSTNTTATVAQIDTAAAPGIQARETSITANPKNYALLVAQANAYSDWASAVLQSTQQETTHSIDLAKSAASYYERALAIKPGDPSVTTDYAIALFYTGDATKAITVAEAVRKANPTFAPVLFNLGIFYANSGTSDGLTKATEALNAYLKLDPTGSNAASAKNVLTQIAAAQKSLPATGTASNPGTTTTP